jgi:hypothetical protein
VKRRIDERRESPKTVRKPRELSIKLARALINGEQLLGDISNTQLQQAFLKVSEPSVAAIDSCTSCMARYKAYYTQSLISQIRVANKALSETLAMFD